MPLACVNVEQEEVCAWRAVGPLLALRRPRSRLPRAALAAGADARLRL